jgi:hypothetical protein
MDVGLIIILHQKFKQDNTDHQRLLLELIIIHLPMFGLLLALSLKWSLEISYLNQEKVRITTKMMTTWLK